MDRTYKGFLNKYSIDKNIKINDNNFNGQLLNTRIDFKIVKNMSTINEKKIWPIMKNHIGFYIVAGFEIKYSIGYMITNEEYSNLEEIYLLEEK